MKPGITAAAAVFFAVALGSAALAEAAEMLVKVASLAAPVMEEYQVRKGGGFFSRRECSYDAALLQALDSGVMASVTGRPGRGYISRASIVPCTVGGPRPEIAEILGTAGKIAGSQKPAGISGWNKLLVDTGGEGAARFFSGEIAAGSSAITHIAVKGSAGTLACREITEKLPCGPGDVYRTDRSSLMLRLGRSGAGPWLRSAMPDNGGAGFLIVRDRDASGAVADTLLVRARREQPSGGGPGSLPALAVVVGWQQAAERGTSRDLYPRDRAGRDMDMQ